MKNIKHEAKRGHAHRHFKKAAIFTIGFAAIATFVIILAIAAIPTAHFVADPATRTTSASVVTDATASGAQAIRFNAPVVSQPGRDRFGVNQIYPTLTGGKNWMS